MPTIYLANSAVIPCGCDGMYSYVTLKPEKFAHLLQWAAANNHLRSHIGYKQNIDLINRWFGVTVSLNRTTMTLEPGDIVLTMRLKHRIPNPEEKGLPVDENIDNWDFAMLSFFGWEETNTNKKKE